MASKSKNITFAAIDIGSNAVRLLIKQLENPESKILTKVQLVRVPLRLGFDVFSKGYISDEKKKDMVRLMKAFRQLMKIYHVDVYRACATSAMRDAANGREIIESIYKATGISIDIIDGKEEAAIIYGNHIEKNNGLNGNLLYVDVGGGSTETNLISEGRLIFSASYNIGTVRMLNGSVCDSEWERLGSDLKGLVPAYPGIDLIGSGGNINKLYKLSGERGLESTGMSVASLRKIHESLASLTVEERIERYDLKPDRADVIVPAARIFLTIAETVAAGYIYIPMIGLSDGIIDGLYSASLNRT